MSSQLVNQKEIAKYLPHRGAICLLEEVCVYDTLKICCQTTTHTDLNNPLRTDNSLPMINGIEYAAQAAALHLVLQNSTIEPVVRQGFLAAVKTYRMNELRLDNIDEPLKIECIQSFVDDSRGAFYEFKLMTQRLLASGQLLIIFNEKKDVT